MLSHARCTAAQPTVALSLLAFVSMLALTPAAEARNRKPPTTHTEGAAAAATAPSSQPSELKLTWHESTPERKTRLARESQGRRALAPLIQTWAARWDRDSQPLLGALERVSKTLASVSDRNGRNICYPLGVAAQRLRRELPAAPVVGIEAEIRPALAEIEIGADLCLAGLSTTAQSTFAQARRRLARAQVQIAAWVREIESSSVGGHPAR